MKAYEWTFVILWLAMSAHQVSGDTECPLGYFKDKLGNAKCSKCPLNSVTETVDRKYCKCRLGYFRAPWKKISDNCTVTTRLNASGDLKVFLKVLSDTSIRVSWKIKSKNGIIQAYYVTYTLVDDPEDTNTIRTTKTTVVVTGLKPGKKYRFVVVAENSVGRISSPASIARTTNKNGDKAVDGSKDTIYIAVSTVLGIALLIALLLLGFYVNRYRIARNTLMRTMDKLQAVEEEIDMDVVEETRVDELQALGV